MFQPYAQWHAQFDVSFHCYPIPITVSVLLASAAFVRLNSFSTLPHLPRCRWLSAKERSMRPCQITSSPACLCCGCLHMFGYRQ